jgi:hypothetical protein
MNANDLRQIASNYLLPFFSGAELEADAVASTPQQACDAWIDPCTIAFKTNPADGERLHLRRSQPFAAENVGEISEKSVVAAFVEVVRSIEPGLAQPYRADLLASLERRVVVKSLANGTFETTLLQSLDQMATWSSRLYEGHPITAAVGFVPNDNTQTVLLSDAWKRDFSAVLTNGHDTLLTANHGGHILGHESLTMPDNLPPYAPNRLAPLAEWAQNGRIVVILNRTGEILVLRDKKLIFARRSGSWHFLTPEAVVTQMGRPSDITVRMAVLATALDVSFARSGGCIGVVGSNHRHHWKNVVVHADDYLTPATSAKAQVLRRAINNARFQNLDRRLRQELVAIDGATVIDHHGEILAVGAILQIPGGSEGGGRLAAARALSALGVGMKISQDGGIRCYHDDNDDPEFLLMESRQ